MKLTKINWPEIIEANRDKLEPVILKQWIVMLDEPITSSMQAFVLLWEDGDISTGYREQNSHTVSEHIGESICAASFQGMLDTFGNTTPKDFDSIEAYIDFMLSEYPPNIDEIIDEAIWGRRHPLKVIKCSINLTQPDI